MKAYDTRFKYYLRIPGLLVPRKLAYDDVHSGIDKYIDTVPALTGSIEDNFENMLQRVEYYDNFLKCMEVAIQLLRNVHARYLERDAETILRCAQIEASVPVARKMLKPFISDLLSLSIEMQKAQSYVDGKANVSEAETSAGIADNLSAVGGLIGDGDYEKAKNVAEEIKESIPGVDIVNLLELITAKKYDEAEALSATMKEKYTEAVTKSVEADMSKKILAVDDRPEMLIFVSGALKSHYKVFGASNGNTAIKVMHTHKPDLFILDIDMPGMNGFELASFIRSRGGHANTPIIFLTGNSDRERVNKAVEVGGNDFIVKPTTHETLLRKVSKFLNVKQQ